LGQPCLTLSLSLFLSLSHSSYLFLTLSPSHLLNIYSLTSLRPFASQNCLSSIHIRSPFAHHHIPVAVNPRALLPSFFFFFFLLIPTSRSTSFTDTAR
jgi:hypothetical protein